jgi:hypothetical protein
MCSKDRKVYFVFDNQYSRFVKKSVGTAGGDEGDAEGGLRTQSRQSERLVIDHDGYVCVYVCMYICIYMYVCLMCMYNVCVCIYIMHACVCVYNVCVCICMYV